MRSLVVWYESQNPNNASKSFKINVYVGVDKTVDNSAEVVPFETDFSIERQFQKHNYIRFWSKCHLL